MTARQMPTNNSKTWMQDDEIDSLDFKVIARYAPLNNSNAWSHDDESETPDLK